MAGRIVDAHETEIIRQTLKLLQTEHGITYQEMESSLSGLTANREAQDYAASIGFNWKFLAFGYDAKSINAFANDKRQTTNNRGTLGALYVWLNYRHHDTYRFVESDVFIPENEPFVDIARKHFGRSPPTSKDIKTLTGFYKFYRPFYRDPNNQIMLCSLEIGKEGIPNYDCFLHMKYEGPTGRDVSVVAKGKIVPIHGRAFALLSVGKNGVFYLYFDKFNRDGDTELVLLAEGTLLGSRDDRQSTALPFVAERVDERVEPKVIARDHNLPPYVSERLAYGAVHWERYPPVTKREGEEKESVA
jgi:hypothetical protein